jgi:hypothetical protein
MSILQSKGDRRILPRWRASDNTSLPVELSALRPLKQVASSIKAQFRSEAADFSSSPSIGTAAELVSSAVLAGDKEVLNRAARFILENEHNAPEALVTFVKSIIGAEKSDKKEKARTRPVVKTRALLRTHSDNPLLWSDMARHYASLGDKNRAFRCIQTALQLAPNHRWVLRTASRFLVHQEDPRAAHKLLATHPRTAYDPWLIAAEIASAQVAKKGSKFWRQAKNMLKLNNLSPGHLSELAIAVGMMELESGERKRARKYVQIGLIVPTENSLAQVFWATENRHLSDGYQLDRLVESADDAYEAEFRLNMAQGNLLAALKSAETWSEDEPFAARPKFEVAYVASLLDNHAVTIEMANQVARLDRDHHPGLEMNCVFALISSGRYSIEKDTREIESLRSQIVRSIERDGETAYHAIANLALWNYRYGDQAEGKNLYQKAVMAAEKAQALEAAALAATFAAREAILANDNSSASILQEAKVLARRSKNKASEFYIRKLDAVLQRPSEASRILCPAAAAEFLPPRVEALRVEKGEDGRYTLWLPSKT